MATQRIGQRIKALRAERNLSQDELAQLFGFKDRQTISAIETGSRRVKAEELLIAAQRLSVTLDYFTDPFLLVGEGPVLMAAKRRTRRPTQGVRTSRRSLAGCFSFLGPAGGS